MSGFETYGLLGQPAEISINGTHSLHGTIVAVSQDNDGELIAYVKTELTGNVLRKLLNHIRLLKGLPDGTTQEIQNPAHP